MNTVVTSREAILSVSRKLVIERGIDAINMRTVAAACGVAVGSVYNYFPSKTSLLTTTVADIWRDIFRQPSPATHSPSPSDSPSNSESPSPISPPGFPEYVNTLFQRVHAGCQEYPGFFTLHSISFATSEKKQARQAMDAYFSQLKAQMLAILQADPLLRADAFNSYFTPKQLVEFTCDSLVSLWLHNSGDCSTLCELLRRSLYN